MDASSEQHPRNYKSGGHKESDSGCGKNALSIQCKTKATPSMSQSSAVDTETVVAKSPVPRAPPPPMPPRTRKQSFLQVDAPAFTPASMMSLVVNTTSPLLPPWLPASNGEAFQSRTLSLHDEIKFFVEYLNPTAIEKARRVEVYQRAKAAIQEIWPRCKVKLYGSFVSNTYLPSSDMDMVVQNIGVQFGTNPMLTLGSHFRSKPEFSYVQVIANATVPIIKMADASTGYLVDVSFNSDNGPKNTELVLKYINQYEKTSHSTHTLKAGFCSYTCTT